MPITASVSVSLSVLIALLVCLMPTTIGGLLPAIGIAGMDRLLQYNFIAMSGRAVEASGDVDMVLMDKTGTITLGNRMATEFIPVDSESENDLINAALLSSLADDTPEGRSIVVLAKEKLGMHGSDIRAPEGAVFCPFSAEARMSGIDCNGQQNKKRIAGGYQRICLRQGFTNIRIVCKKLSTIFPEKAQHRF